MTQCTALSSLALSRSLWYLCLKGRSGSWLEFLWGNLAGWLWPLQNSQSSSVTQPRSRLPARTRRSLKSPLSWASNTLRFGRGRRGGGVGGNEWVVAERVEVATVAVEVRREEGVRGHGFLACPCSPSSHPARSSSRVLAQDHH